MLSMIVILKIQLRNQNDHIDLTLHLYIVDLGLESVNPVDLKSFCSSVSDKHQFQVASRKFLQNKSFLDNMDVIISRYMTEAYGVYPGECSMAGAVTEDPELCFSIEEACQKEVKRVVVIYSLVYHQRFCEIGIQELWVKFGIKVGCRNITICKLGQQLGWEKCSALLKAHILTGCDATSKIGTKAPAVFSKRESYHDDFGIKPLRDSSFVCAKKYLVRVIRPKSNCKTFEDLRNEMCKAKEKALNGLPSTSSTFRGHLLRSHYFVYLCSNLLDSCSKIIEHVNCWWIIENGLLVPTKSFTTISSDLTTKCRYKKWCTENCGCKRTFTKCTKYWTCTNCKNV